MPALLVLGLWIVLQFFAQVGTPASEATSVAYMAHIGGCLTGIVLSGSRLGRATVMAAGRRLSIDRVSC